MFSPWNRWGAILFSILASANLWQAIDRHTGVELSTMGLLWNYLPAFGLFCAAIIVARSKTKLETDQDD
jgi:hypothetical protein